MYPSVFFSKVVEMYVNHPTAHAVSDLATVRQFPKNAEWRQIYLPFKMFGEPAQLIVTTSDQITVVQSTGL